MLEKSINLQYFFTFKVQTRKIKPVQCTMTESGDTMIAHIQVPATQRPADVWITTTALRFIGVHFCCAACLEVSRALKESPTLHRGPQA